MPAARARLAEAETALTDARAARDALAERQRQASGTNWSARKVEQAALAVIAAEAGPHAARLTKRVATLRRELAHASHEWRWLVGHGALPVIEEHGDGFGRPRDPDAKELFWRLNPVYLNRDDDLNAPALRGDGAWAEAFTALQQDAATPLPVRA